ncbi:hypothetical protein GQ600_9254 [Phytophthora cactorum]|nr:hypothetical protein GQ600_9254 [Phytophthora cactorum]
MHQFNITVGQDGTLVPTSVGLVLRHKLSARPESVDGVVSDLLISDMPLSRTCHLSRTDPRYTRCEFTNAMVTAIRRIDLHMVQWLLGLIPSILTPPPGGCGDSCWGRTLVDVATAGRYQNAQSCSVDAVESE